MYYSESDIKMKADFQLKQKFKMRISLLTKDILAYKKYILCGEDFIHIRAQ